MLMRTVVFSIINLFVIPSLSFAGEFADPSLEPNLSERLSEFSRDIDKSMNRFRNTILFGQGAICGSIFMAAVSAPTIKKWKILAPIAAAAICAKSYYDLMDIGNETEVVSNDNEARKLISSRKDLSLATFVFGDDVVIELLKLSKKERTRSNIDEILARSAGLIHST